MNRFVTINLLTLFLLLGSAIASEETWRLERSRDGIQIYSRAVSGSEFRAIRGTTCIRGSLTSIVSLLQDMTYWPKLNSIIASAQVYERLSPTDSLLYFQMNMPWPVSDRDVLNYRTIQQDRMSKVVTITDVATRNRLPEVRDFVRIVDSSQRWTLSPNGDGTIDVVWITHTDPNGPIPAQIVNFLSVGAPFDSLNTLRTAIESGEFKAAKLTYITEPQ